MGRPPRRVEHGDMDFWVLPALTATFLALFFAIRNERVRRLLVCPLKNETAEVELVQRYRKPDRVVRVKTCSLLSDPKRVGCGQVCIHNPL